MDNKPKELISVVQLPDGSYGIKSCYTKRMDVLNILLKAVEVLALSSDQPEPSKIITPSILDMRKVGL